MTSSRASAAACHSDLAVLSRETPHVCRGIAKRGETLPPPGNGTGSSNSRLQPDERSCISLAPGYPTRGGWPAQGLRQIRSYLVRCASIASQAFSASANVLKGDPPTLMAGLLI